MCVNFYNIIYVDFYNMAALMRILSNSTACASFVPHPDKKALKSNIFAALKSCEKCGILETFLLDIMMF